jgi:hypothetical protein
MGIIVAPVRAYEQRAEVQRNVYVLARQAVFNEASLAELARTYEGQTARLAAKRYARKLLALYRAGLFTYSDFSNCRDWQFVRWTEIEDRAHGFWVTRGGEKIKREELSRRMEEKRKPPKSERARCAAIAKSGDQCRAKAAPESELCRFHERLSAAQK